MTFLDWLGANWLLILVLWWLFGGGVTVAARRYVKGRRKHKLAVRELELKIARERNGVPALTRKEEKTLPKPGPCVHRNVKAVVSAFPEEKVVGWLCECSEQLPANWAVRQEDL